MSKKVELIIEIDSKGNILITPKGTVGSECIELMAFLDKIESFKVTTVDLPSNQSIPKDISIEKISQKIK